MGIFTKTATGYRKVAPNFRPYDASQLRALLSQEFGDAFQVTHTGNYLVVHPRGQRNLWAQRFESLNKSFGHYFAVRGFQFSRPKFPLVAVVYPTREGFFRQAAREGAKIDNRVVGYYSPTTNRVLVYDANAGNAQASMDQNLATIIHEATHQTAFNVGLHNRFGENPRWVVEGLGTMFEARGVWNSRKYTNLKDRVNAQQLSNFRAALPNRAKGSLAEFISTDRTFNTNPFAAYGEAWALTFYLSERRHQQYLQYLRKVAKRPLFRNYTAPERLRDFVEVFGPQINVLEAQFLQFMAELN